MTGAATAGGAVRAVQWAENAVRNPMAAVKDLVIKLAQELPEDATWDDVLYEVELRRKIERGLRQADAGLGVPVDEVRKQFGLQ